MQNQDDNNSGYITFRSSTTWQLLRKIGALFVRKK